MMTKKLLSDICLIAVLLTMLSCANDMAVINKFIDAEIEPDIFGENVEILYSDSARLQMKMVTPLMKEYSSATEQRREFPQGLHVWFYEKTGELKAEITANWARHDLITEIWEARNNVVITNIEGRKLETEQLFWDRQRGIVYSEKYTKVTSQDGQIATGDKFTARQDFSSWKLIQGRATIILQDEEIFDEED